MRYAIGVDIGGTKIRAAVANEKGKFLIRLIEKTEKKTRIDIPNQIMALINSLSFDLRKVEGIGIGTIGPLDTKRGIITAAANMPFKNIPIVKPLSQLGLPIYFLNDCDAAVIGEHEFGAGKNLKDLVYVTLSTGIGTGAYIDDTLLLGKDGNATEMGHTTIDYEGKLLCGCGRKGHWEAYCSGNNIPNLVRYLVKNKFKSKNSLLFKYAGKDLSKLNAKILFDSAKARDKLSLQIVDEIGRLNAIGISNVIGAYDPELITIGGSVALNNPKLVLDPIKKYVKDYSINRIPEIKITRLGDSIGLYGAVAAVFNPPKNLKPIK
jgi:glucokinase